MMRNDETCECTRSGRSVKLGGGRFLVTQPQARIVVSIVCGVYTRLRCPGIKVPTYWWRGSDCRSFLTALSHQRCSIPRRIINVMHGGDEYYVQAVMERGFGAYLRPAEPLCLHGIHCCLGEVLGLLCGDAS